MSYYEMLIIARQELTPTQVDSIMDSFESLIKNSGGIIHRRENWGLVDLQYQIKKNKKGFYILINYQSEPDVMKELERKMNLSQDILRFLTIKTDKPITEMSIFLKRKEMRQMKDELSSSSEEEVL